MNNKLSAIKSKRTLYKKAGSLRPLSFDRCPIKLKWENLYKYTPKKLYKKPSGR